MAKRKATVKKRVVKKRVAKTRVARKRVAKKPPVKRTAAKRQLIDTGTDKRYVRRSPKGKFKESDDVGKSLTTDRRKKAKAKVKSGQGDKGDR